LELNGTHQLLVYAAAAAAAADDDDIFDENLNTISKKNRGYVRV
jgi:hypothetical protein